MGHGTRANQPDADESLTLMQPADPLVKTGDPLVQSTEENGSFFNCLHNVSGIAAVVLILFVIAANRQYAGRVEGHKTNASSSIAFVYLASSADRDVANLAYSLESLSTNFNAIAGYRVIIVHDGSMNQSIQTDLQSNFPSHIEFRNTSLLIPTEIFEQYNLSSADPPFTKRGKWNYQNMNRWWYKVFVSEQSPLSDVDVIARMDTDTAFTTPVERDFLADFTLGKKVYAYSRIRKQCTLVDGLKDMAVEYVEMNSIRPQNNALWSEIVRNKRSPCVPSFANFFEVIDLRFWRTHQGVRGWQEVVDENGGIYRNGWGDGTLRYLTVSMFCREEKVLQLPKMRLGSYEHPHKLAKEMAAQVQ